MLISFGILLFALVLCLYSLRHVSLTILKNSDGRDYSNQVASANRLMFVHARSLLSEQETGAARPDRRSLDQLARSLDRDYVVISYLLKNGAPQSAIDGVHRIILALDFQLMRLQYWGARMVSNRLAKSALVEMTSIIRHQANRIGQVWVARRA